MAACAAYALRRASWRLQLDRAAIAYGFGSGLLGSVGTLLMFVALRSGPAYIVVPVASMYPAVTVILAVMSLGERASRLAAAGIASALAAIVLLSMQDPDRAPIQGWIWLVCSILAMLMFGVQGWLIKQSARALDEESMFFYMAAAAVVLAPLAVLMTDFSQPVNWGLAGPWLTAAIQLPNAIGALLSIYAYRAGRAIIVAPLIGLYPLVTIVLSLAIYHRVPDLRTAAGMVLALAAIAMMAAAEAGAQPAKSVTAGDHSYQP
jgi:drug/metabolite transporter (DMT)-like permease